METQVKQLIITVILVCSIVFSGCIGGNDGGSGSDAVDTAGETNSKSTTTTLDGVPGVSILEGIVKSDEINSYASRYTITSYSAGVSSRVSYNSYSKEGLGRVDFIEVSADENTESRIYDLPGYLYVCVHAEGQWLCFNEAKQSVEETLSEVTYLIDVEDILTQTAAESILYTGEEEMGGIKSKCFRSAVGERVSKFCVHPEYPILMKFETMGITVGDEGYLLMVTESLDLNPPEDSVFELPEFLLNMSSSQFSGAEDGIVFEPPEAYSFLAGIIGSPVYADRETPSMS